MTAHLSLPHIYQDTVSCLLLSRPGIFPLNWFLPPVLSRPIFMTGLNQIAISYFANFAVWLAEVCAKFYSPRTKLCFALPSPGPRDLVDFFVQANSNEMSLFCGFRWRLHQTGCLISALEIQTDKLFFIILLMYYLTDKSLFIVHLITALVTVLHPITSFTELNYLIP